MSYAIFDLELEAPPATVRQFATSDGVRWVVRCEICGRRTTPRPLLSAALRDQFGHGRKHYREMLQRAVSTGKCRQIHRRRGPGGELLGAQRLDVVHLSEPQRKVS